MDKWMIVYLTNKLLICLEKINVLYDVIIYVKPEQMDLNSPYYKKVEELINKYSLEKDEIQAQLKKTEAK